MTGRTPEANNVLVESLGSSLQRGGSSLESVPGLLKQVLQEESWREFVTRRGDLVAHERFAEFESTPPLAGLGASAELIDRIVGTDDPELLRLLRAARSVGQGTRTDLLPLDSKGSEGYGHSSDYTVERLARQAPDEYAAVERGEKTINAASLDAGIRKHRISVRLDDPESAARSIWNNASAEFWEAFCRSVARYASEPEP